MIKCRISNIIRQFQAHKYISVCRSTKRTHANGAHPGRRMLMILIMRPARANRENRRCLSMLFIYQLLLHRYLLRILVGFLRKIFWDFFGGQGI